MIARGIARCVALGDRACRFVAGFFETRAPQSMVRAVALLFAFDASLVAIAASEVAHRPHLVPEHIAMLDALTRLATLFVAGGAVALLTRTRSNGAAPGGV